jgi:hypothetical protein
MIGWRGYPGPGAASPLLILTERSNAVNRLGKNKGYEKAAERPGAGAIRVGLGKHRTERGKKATGRGQVGAVERGANRFFRRERGAQASPTPPSPLALPVTVKQRVDPLGDHAKINTCMST